MLRNETRIVVAVIEHNLEVIKTAGWVIDLGPEGGDEIVAFGPAGGHRKEAALLYGEFLKSVLAKKFNTPKKRRAGGEGGVSEAAQ